MLDSAAVRLVGPQGKCPPDVKPYLVQSATALQKKHKGLRSAVDQAPGFVFVGALFIWAFQIFLVYRTNMAQAAAMARAMQAAQQRGSVNPANVSSSSVGDAPQVPVSSPVPPGGPGTDYVQPDRPAGLKDYIAAQMERS